MTKPQFTPLGEVSITFLILVALSGWIIMEARNARIERDAEAFLRSQSCISTGMVRVECP